MILTTSNFLFLAIALTGAGPSLLSIIGSLVVLSVVGALLTRRDPSGEQPSLFRRLLHSFQLWAIPRPNNLVSQLVLPVIRFVEGGLANFPLYLPNMRRWFGPNFCCSGQVVLGEFKELERILTSPQKRTYRLGSTVLTSSALPNTDVKERNIFLLALSDHAAGGDGSHEGFRQAVLDYCLNEASQARQKDETAEALFDRLVADYRELPHGRGEAFFTTEGRGWPDFLIRYVHYALFGIDPQDEEKVGLFTDVYFTRRGPSHYFAVLGPLAERLNLFGQGGISQSIEEIAKVYEASPALADFVDGDDTYKAMTRYELAKLMTSIVSITTQGPLALGNIAFGNLAFPDYVGTETASIKQEDVWDTLDLGDRDALERYLLECARLWPPVSATHHVAPEEFTAKIGDKDYTFPADTIVMVPMSLGLMDEEFWGPTTYKFNPDRENLCPYHMGFNSVGDKSAGRICPGKGLALDMLSECLVRLGEVRRQDVSD